MEGSYCFSEVTDGVAKGAEVSVGCLGGFVEVWICHGWICETWGRCACGWCCET